jgi:hypothetical protein
VNCIDCQLFRSQFGHNLSEQNYQLSTSIQVNIAADGGQQVNVREKGKTNKKKPTRDVMNNESG